MGAPAKAAKSDFRTPLKRVRGLGAAGHGVEHFIVQRASAVALAVLIPLFLGLFAWNARGGAEALAGFLGSPLGALLTLAFFAVACLHMRIGVQEVIDDYVQASLPRAALLLVNTVLTVALWAGVSFAILYLAFGG